MEKKQFQTESKKILDLMINSIYTHNEIFIRELISNASDAIDKIYYKSLSDGNIGMNRDDFFIKIYADKDARTLTVQDNGCGMSEEELEKNLGTIAHSGSSDFKKSIDSDDINIIGQFGVGFYSSFMVADKVTVKTKQYGSDVSYEWESSGTDGYTIEKSDYDNYGTQIILHIKENSDNYNYDEFLQDYKLESLIKKYSDYIRYPIILKKTVSKPKKDKEDEFEDVIEDSVINSMIPIWKKSEEETDTEEINNFYKEKFFDFENPLKTIKTKTEGTVNYYALLFVPSHAPYDYYSKNFQKGLQLYSNGVLIMDKCPDILPDYFSFVTGLIDSDDFTLNISREVLQHDKQLKNIAKNIEKKIKSELLKIHQNTPEDYIKFFEVFGNQIKYGVYSDYGLHKDLLSDLLIFKSTNNDEYTDLDQYISRKKESQNSIYYACGESIDKIQSLPQLKTVKEKGYEVLYFTDDVDEFAIKTLGKYKDLSFVNIGTSDFNLLTDDEKDEIKKINDDNTELINYIKESLGDKVKEVRFTLQLSEMPSCLSSEGEISIEMEKVLRSMPNNNDRLKADLVLEINYNHPIYNKIVELFNTDKEKLSDVVKMLYYQASIYENIPINNPTEFGNLITSLLI